MRSTPILGAIACLLCLHAAVGVRASEGPRPLRIAAAADLKYALDEIVQRYREVHPGVRIDAIFGSSGKLYAQLANGAPFDVFLSADAIYPRKLVDEGVAVPGSELPYAVGRIVLWVPRESPLPVEADGMRVLLSPSVRKVAIANPRHAPYGRAAEAALRRYGVYERVKDRLVFGENASQTAQFAQTRSVEAAIIPLSLATAPALATDGRHWLVPLDAHPKLEQVGVRIRSSPQPEEARRFTDFLAAPESRAILKRYGFVLPGE